MSDGLFWVPHPELIWTPGQLKGTDVYSTDHGDVSVKEADRGQEITDPQELRGVPDCCSLTHVSAATILHTVRVRFARSEIYTNVSNVLIAVNPFKPMALYSQEFIELYRGAQDIGNKPPHIFGLCAQAFAGLMSNESSQCASQAVLISGESGAGKTETTKLVLLYTSEMLAGQEGGIEDILVEINPILEAFGNAKTVRNNNSSRFGKWIEVRVDPASRSLQGVQVVDYLLEVTRVTGQGPGERNYHIFYQLAGNAGLQKTLKLQDAAKSSYLKTNPMEIDGVDDEKELKDLRRALTTLDFSSQEEDGIFRTSAAILHIGNLDFEAGADTKVSTPESLNNAAELLGVDADALSKCVCFKRIVTGKDVMMSPLDDDKARAARDSMAKFVYGLLFKWLVRRCNEALGKNIGGSGETGGQFIGVLDIAGFESFEKNLLEQLLINLSNEKLQNFFNNTVFTTELEEYKAEEINIDNINFADNTDVLAFIEGPGGLLAMLDDATTGVKQTDETLTAKLVKEKATHARFLKPKKFDPLVFGIKHYAGDVMYNTTGFLEKNAQSQPPEMIELLAGSNIDMMQDVVKEPEEPKDAAPPKPGARGGAKKKSTVSAAFKKSLAELMEKLKTAQCHFTRCIKPNKEKLPDKFNSEMIMDQLRLCGVMETVEIRKCGFQMRTKYPDFVSRYVITVDSKEERKKITTALRSGGDLKEASSQILDNIQTTADQFALGKTKVLMKSKPFNALEDKRRGAFEPFAVTIQRMWRGCFVRGQMVDVKDVHKDLMECMSGSGHKLRSDKASVKQVARATIVEGSLKHFDLILMRAVNLPIKLGYLHEASKVRANMAAEATLARKLANLSLQVNIFEMEEALAQAEQYKMEGELVECVKKRLQEAKSEMPMKQSLQNALNSDEYEDLKAAVGAATEKGYNELKKWIQPSGAAVMEQAMARLEALELERKKQEEAKQKLLKEVEDQLASVDLQAVQEVLARAAANSLKAESVDQLNARCVSLERQTQMDKELQSVLASSDVAELQAVVQKMKDAATREEWLLPKIAANLEEAELRIVSEAKKVAQTPAKTADANKAKSKGVSEEVKAALKHGCELEPLLALQARFAEHLTSEEGQADDPLGVKVTAETTLKEKLDTHIERLQAEMSLVEELMGAIKAECKGSDIDNLSTKCDEGKWAKGSEFWIRKDGWTIYQQFQEKKERTFKIEIALTKLKGAADAYDCEEMEAAFTQCAELGVPPADIDEYHKVFTQLQRVHQVRDLQQRSANHEIRACNLKKQMEYLEAKEAGMESMIVLQLKRLINSQSVETMRLQLRKADRAEIREPIVDEIRKRADEIEKQEPFVQMLRDATWSRNGERIKKAIGDFEQMEGENLKDPSTWYASGLQQMYESAKQCLDELEKAHSHLEEFGQDFLHYLEKMITSTDPEEIQSALKEAESRNVGGELVAQIRTRLTNLQRQQRMVEEIRLAIYSQDDDVAVQAVASTISSSGLGLTTIEQDIMERLINEGLDSPEKWVVEDGPRTFAQLAAKVKEVEAERAKISDKDTEIRKQIRELVKSTDVQEIKDVLARATIYKVKTELTRTMEKRIELLERQAGHLKDLRKCLQETDAIVVAEAISKVRKDYLDNPSNWELPEGPKIFSKVVQRKAFCEKVEDLELAIRRASRVYDVQVLQNCFREAEELAVPADMFQEAKMLLLSLQNGDNISRLIIELQQQIQEAEKEDPRLVQGIKNLVDQQKQLGLQVNSGALQDVSQTIARGRARARSRGKSCFDAEDEDDRELARTIFEDLTNLKCLRDPLQWDAADGGSASLEARARAMVSFQADKITISLTVCSARQEIIALQNFQDILRCMGDKPCAFTGNKEEPIVRRLTLSRKVCDEIYVQVMKQLTDNPSEESRTRGWQLLKRMTQSVLPSAEVYEFLRCFVQREAEPPMTRASQVISPEKKDYRRFLMKSARKVLEDQEEAAAMEGEGGNPFDGAKKKIDFATVARMAAKKNRSTVKGLEQAEDDLDAMKESTSQGGAAMRPRKSRRKSLAAAAEERVRQEEKSDDIRKQRAEKQSAMASEILNILTHD